MEIQTSPSLVIVENCMICNQESDHVLRILQKPICVDCEQKIVLTTMDEPQKYIQLVSSMKKLWLNENDLSEEGTY